MEDEELSTEYEIKYDDSDFEEAEEIARLLGIKVENKTINTLDDIDDDEFFTDENGNPTIVNRYDFEKEIPNNKKPHLRELQRYWVNKPFAFVSIVHSERENEKKYYLIEPHLNTTESSAIDFLTEKLRASIRYTDEDISSAETKEEKRGVIESKTHELLNRYDFYESKSPVEQIKSFINSEDQPHEEDVTEIPVRPEDAVVESDADYLTPYQIQKILYYLKRNFIGYERIDGVTHDINVEDISCDGYNQPVFVYHSEYEQLISNIEHGEEQLDDFVINLAQQSGKGISKRNPQIDATLPNGSRAQLTLGKEVSDHGTNYTIRQFKEIPFTPVDLINWNTFSLNQMAFLWLAIENHRSLMFAGGTASGKTTSLNAVSLFIPSNSKIVSIEDTREVELPQRNWVASVTRPSFTGDEQGSVDEFDLLESALRQRPDYIVFGEVRGEEGRTLFQVMSTGHTTYTTFHADSVSEVIKRFTTEPINVSKTLFTSLDLVSIQTQTRVDGNKVRRSKVITEINKYDPESDEINVQDVYQWDAEDDEFNGFEDTQNVEEVSTLEEIRFDRGWTTDELKEELAKRRIVLAYLVKNNLNEYTQVAATVQAFINDADTILTLIANNELEERLQELRQMENILIDVTAEDEKNAPRPSVTDETKEEMVGYLDTHRDILEKYKGKTAGTGDLVDALPSASEQSIEAGSVNNYEFLDAEELRPNVDGEPNIKRDTVTEPTNNESDK